MESAKVITPKKAILTALILAVVGGISFLAGFAWSAEGEPARATQPRVIYPKKTELDFEGTKIEGEIRNPGEYYFQHRTEEKFDSLVKRRKNFHREMLRDVVLSK